MRGKSIGLFVDFTNNSYLVSLIEGMSAAAKKFDTSIVCFEGGYLYSTDIIDGSRDILYNMASPENIQGLIIPVTSLGLLASRENLEEFLKRFQGIPIVTIGESVGDYPCIFPENKLGMMRLMDHLIVHHGYKRFAYVTGPEDNNDAIERFSAFRKSLKDYRLSIKDEHIFKGDFSPQTAYLRAQDILKCLKKEKLDAIVTVNDNSALMIQDYLTANGIRIPEDVAVTGFDNNRLSQYSNPPLTTIHQPAYNIGMEALRILNEMIQGKTFHKKRIILKTYPVFRDSCGCTPWVYSASLKEGMPHMGDMDIHGEIQRVLEQSELFSGLDFQLFIGPLVFLLIETLENKDEASYRKEFQLLLENLLEKSQEPIKHIRSIGLVFNLMSSHYPKPKDLYFFASLGHNTIFFAEEKLKQIIGHEQLQMVQLEDAIIQLTRNLMVVMTKENFLRELSVMLPKVGVLDCIIALRRDGGNGYYKAADCIFALKNGECLIPIQQDELAFESVELTPKELWGPREQKNKVVYPFVHGSKTQGFIILSNFSISLESCEHLYSIINYTFSNFYLIEQIQEQQERLLDSERGLKQAQEIGMIGSWLWNRDTSQLSLSEEMRRILGLKRDDEITTMDDLLMDFIHPEDMEQKNIFMGGLEGDVTVENLEFRIIRKNKEKRWISASIAKDASRLGSAGTSFIMGIVQDITERKVVALELQNAQKYISSIIDSMPSLLVGVDDRGVVTQWNAKASEVSGISAYDALGMPLERLLPQLQGHMDLIFSAIKSKKEHRIGKSSRVDGYDKIYEDITVYPLVAQGVEGAVIRVDDITHRVRMEEMMVQSEKMMSVGGLAAGMAHEINNPLGGMMQTAEVLGHRLSDTSLPANIRAAQELGLTMNSIKAYMDRRNIPEMLDRIHQSGKRAADIVQNMLSFSRRGSDINSTHHLPELLDRCVELSGVDYDLKKKYDFRQVEIIREYTPDLPPVPCDAGKIQQVIMNILRNGVEAMYTQKDNDGDRKKPRFILRLKCGKKGKYVKLEIEDNGPGMTEDVRKRIFEPFFTTKPTNQGTGLGLSVSYFIITENHGGQMSVLSQEGQGTTFVIKLPIRIGENLS